MSDVRLREFERCWIEAGTPEAREAYNRELVRMGLPKLPREVVRHYVKDELHGNLGPDGKFDINVAHARQRTHVITSRCNVELWPREAGWPGYRSTMRKNIYYTEDEDEVTCKSCIRSLAKPDKRIYRREHYAPGSMSLLANGKEVLDPVCGRNDSARFEETFSYNMRSVTCPACKRIMTRGRRRARRPRHAVLAQQ